MAQDWCEGRDGHEPRYNERLWPSTVVIVLVVALAAIVGVAYGAAYGPTWGWGAAILLSALGLSALAATSTALRVDDKVFRAGRARLPLAVVAHAQPLNADQMRHERRHGDPRAYVVLRAWSSRVGVAIDIDDPRDPHPRWIVSSRHPVRLASAITDSRARLTGSAGAE